MERAIFELFKRSNHQSSPRRSSSLSFFHLFFSFLLSSSLLISSLVFSSSILVFALPLVACLLFSSFSLFSGANRDGAILHPLSLSLSVISSLLLSIFHFLFSSLYPYSPSSLLVIPLLS